MTDAIAKGERETAKHLRAIHREIFQMSYNSDDDNAMILPVPVRQPSREDSLRFIDLKDDSDFFRALDRGFPFIGPALNSACSGPYDPNWRRDLRVFEVGNYIASFVPSLNDVSRLDDRFTLPTLDEVNNRSPTQPASRAPARSSRNGERKSVLR